ARARGNANLLDFHGSHRAGFPRGRYRRARRVGTPAIANVTTDMNQVVGRDDIVLITLDTLRFDVADAAFRAGETPQFARIFPAGWEERHTPGSFTYSAHHAFFAGFLPTPAQPPWPSRLFAARFAGSETTGRETWVFEEANLVAALRARGYHTI